MNRASLLFDELYVRNLFRQEILPKYSDFVDVGKIAIKPYKKLIWETTYHVVIEYKTVFITREKKKRQLSIICSAHSNDPRLNFYEGMQFLWNKGFGNGYYSIPRPLFYSEYFNGLFYRAAKGNNLYTYIKTNDRQEIESIIPKAAVWFAKLHRLPAADVKNFNAKNSRIATVLPGLEHILLRVQHDYPNLHNIFSELYKVINNNEKYFFNSTDKRWLIHGDAHPENIIRMSRRKIAVIDFSDLCIADFARDLGCFIQQLGYMSNRKIGDRDYIKKIQQLFLDSYFKASKYSLDDNLQFRIDNYYNWTTMRTATHFLIKDGPEPERALPLIKEVADRLKINFSF